MRTPFGRLLRFGQRLDLRHRVAQRHAADKVGADQHPAFPVVTLDRGRTLAEADIGQRGQGDGDAAWCVGTARVSISLRSLRADSSKLDADRDLAVARVELGEVGVGIADGGDPDRLGDGFRRDAVTGGLVQAGDDADFRPVEPGAGRRVGEARLAPHRRFQGGDGVARARVRHCP